MPMNYNFKTTSSPLLFGLSLLAILGLVMMIIALAAGVNVDEATGNLLLFVFLGGLVFLVLGIGTWIVIVQPFRHFDDINQPLDDGHGHSHEAAIVPHEEHEHALETTDHGHH
jgi:ABC-type multidrug transport system permease subunit